MYWIEENNARKRYPKGDYGVFENQEDILLAE